MRYQWMILGILLFILSIVALWSLGWLFKPIRARRVYRLRKTLRSIIGCRKSAPLKDGKVEKTSAPFILVYGSRGMNCDVCEICVARDCATCVLAKRERDGKADD